MHINHIESLMIKPALPPSSSTDRNTLSPHKKLRGSSVWDLMKDAAHFLLREVPKEWRRRKKAQHLMGFEPTLSCLLGVFAPAVLQPIGR